MQGQELKSLRYMRMRATLTQTELAEKSGVRRETIVRLEKGKQRARPGTIRKLAAALRVEPHTLKKTKPR